MKRPKIALSSFAAFDNQPYFIWLVEEFGDRYDIGFTIKTKEILKTSRTWSARRAAKALFFDLKDIDVLILPGYSGPGEKNKLSFEERVRVYKWLSDGGKCLAICDGVFQLVPHYPGEDKIDMKDKFFREQHLGRGFRETVVGKADVIKIEHDNACKLLYDKDSLCIIPIAAAADESYADILAFQNWRAIFSPLHIEIPHDWKLETMTDLQRVQKMPGVDEYLEYYKDNYETNLKPYANYHAQLRQVIYQDFLGLEMKNRVEITQPGIKNVLAKLEKYRPWWNKTQMQK